MTIQDAIEALTKVQDKNTELWLQDPRTADCYPVNHINLLAMTAEGKITSDSIDDDYVYPAVVFGSGG